jgi:hypothetical protein
MDTTETATTTATKPNQNVDANGDPTSLVIGVAWDKESKNNPGIKYQSIAFLGKKDTDEYEVILRRKSDGSELPLYESSCVMFLSKKKEGDNPKKPDRVIRVFLS